MKPYNIFHTYTVITWIVEITVSGRVDLFKSKENIY